MESGRIVLEGHVRGAAGKRGRAGTVPGRWEATPSRPKDGGSTRSGGHGDGRAADETFPPSSSDRSNDRRAIGWPCDARSTASGTASPGREYGQQVREAAAGLLAVGLEPGDRVAILGDNRPEWLICHLAAMTVGGVTCGVYPTSAPDQVAYVVGHSESKLLFVENEEQVDKVLQIIDELERSSRWSSGTPKGLWGFSHPRIIYFDEFMQQGSDYLLEATPRRFESGWRPIDAGRHGHDDLHLGHHRPPQRGHDHPPQHPEHHRGLHGGGHPSVQDDEMLSYLPLAHIYENLISLFQAIWARRHRQLRGKHGHAGRRTCGRSLPTVFCQRAPDLGEIRLHDRDPDVRFDAPQDERFTASRCGVGLRYVKSRKGAEQGGLLWALALLAPLLAGPLPPETTARLRTGALAVCAAAPASPELFQLLQRPGNPAAGRLRPDRVHRGDRRPAHRSSALGIRGRARSRAWR